MELKYIYIFFAILGMISIISVIFCIVRGKGILHKMLIFVVSLLGVVAMICLGGNAILSMLGMGWRCKPFNTMLNLCFVLVVYVLLCGIWELISLKDMNPALIGCGVTSMSLAIFIALISTFFYFNAFSWRDGLTTYNDQTIVYANDQHGGSCDWRYYTHINDLVHGVEILQEDGWIGNPPRNYKQTESN